MDRNLGATRVALSKDDYKAYGNLYQWGRDSDGHELILWKSSREGEAINGITTETSDTPSNSLFIIGSVNWRDTRDHDLWNGMNAINNICPSGFRVPTMEELRAEMNTWITKDSDGAFNSPLKLVLAGYRSSHNGNVVNAGIDGDYWSSSSSSSHSALLSLAFFSDSRGYATDASTHLIARGLSVRCIKDYSNFTGNLLPIAEMSTRPSSHPPSDFATVAWNDIIKFDASGSTDSDGEIVAYEWKDGNVILSNSIEFEKNNFSPGEHKIYLTVTDNEGAKSTIFRIIKVGKSNNIKPKANILRDEITVGLNEEIIVDASTSYDSDGKIVDYSWSVREESERLYLGVPYFPKKAIQTFIIDERSFSDYEVYIFTLTVKDDDGAIDTDTITIRVVK